MRTEHWPTGRIPTTLLDRHFAPGTCRVIAVVIASLDGRATIDGRSGGLGSEADRSVLAFLRATAQAILVGSATARDEGYGPALVRNEELRSLRARLGIGGTEVPICIATRATAPDFAARAVDLDKIRTRAELFGACGVEPSAPGHLLVEGGPTILATLLERRVIDELSLTVAPIVAGEAEAPLVPRILAAPLTATPLALVSTERELLWRLGLPTTQDRADA